MKITPAILTDAANTLYQLTESYSKVFKSIDFDYCKPPFVQSSTVSISEIITVILEKREIDFGIHLMTQKPMEELRALLNSNLRFGNLRINFHQESDDMFYISSLELPVGWSRGVVIKKNSDLLPLEFYSKFDEVQLMTVELGFQGGRFTKNVLKKANELRKMGYLGKISVDGGVNPKTLKIIKNFQIDRVSVGSFFQKSVNLQKSYAEINKVLTDT